MSVHPDIKKKKNLFESFVLNTFREPSNPDVNGTLLYRLGGVLIKSQTHLIL